ncbi:MAG: hypothetical protein PVJ02_15680 [Gemmatimonadota bacterium]|jgi:hypothetical protein
MQSSARLGALCALLSIAAAATACSDGAQPLAPDAVTTRVADPVTELNPQPEPPSLELRFQLTFDGEWSGTVFVGDQACGSMRLVPVLIDEGTSSETGTVTHVAYGLGITGSNPDFTLQAGLSGIVEQGMVVLNGPVTDGAYAGQILHPRGEIQSEGGATTLTGSVQLNPQPEPPSEAYPPSPCQG